MPRFEYKYRIDPGCLPALRARLRPFMLPDSHTVGKPGGQYTIRSVYFDTRSLRDYYEKLSGIERRRKLRIRVYDQQRPASVAYLEVKRKQGDLVTKLRAPMLYSNAGALLATGDIDGYIIANDGVACAAEHARAFLYYLAQGGMIPTVLVAYEREPWVGKFDHGVRITFDTALRFTAFPQVDGAYRETGMVRCSDNTVIVEIKFDGAMPVWARGIVAEFGLRRTSVSKYCTGIDCCLHGDGRRTVLRELRTRPVAAILVRG